MTLDPYLVWSEVLHDVVHTSRWGRTYYRVPGVDALEWDAYHRHDYDDVDRLYVDHETIGGG